MNLWQEMDCPNGTDMDLFGAEMLYQGQWVKCPWCGDQHKAGVDMPIETHLVREEGGQLEVLGMPKDADELAAWRREYDGA